MYLHGEKLAEALDLVDANIELFKLSFDLETRYPQLGSEETCRELRKLVESLVDIQVHVLFSNSLALASDKLKWLRATVFSRICRRLDGRISNTTLPRWSGLNHLKPEPLDDEVYLRLSKEIRDGLILAPGDHEANLSTCTRADNFGLELRLWSTTSRHRVAASSRYVDEILHRIQVPISPEFQRVLL